MKFVLLVLVAIFLIAFFIMVSVRGSRPQVVVGGLYSARAGENKWGIVKVLAHEGKTTHVRLYSNTYPERSRSVEPNELFLGAMNDPGGAPAGVGHLPVTDAVFFSWAPKLIRVVDISEEEIEGYRSFKEAGGRPFDGKWFRE